MTPFPPSRTRELGFRRICSSEGDGTSPPAFTLPGQPPPPPTDSLQPKALESRPDVQPGLPHAAANTSQTLRAPAGANSWFASCPGAPGHPRAKPGTKSCREPPRGPWVRAGGRKVLPHLPDVAHPKTKSPFLVLTMRFPFLKPSPRALSGSNSRNPDDLLSQILFGCCYKDWQLPKSCPTQGPEAGATSATQATLKLYN